LIAATRGSRRLISRSFLVPKTLPKTVLINLESFGNRLLVTGDSNQGQGPRKAP